MTILPSFGAQLSFCSRKTTPPPFQMQILLSFLLNTPPSYLWRSDSGESVAPFTILSFFSRLRGRRSHPSPWDAIVLLFRLTRFRGFTGVSCCGKLILPPPLKEVLVPPEWQAIDQETFLSCDANAQEFFPILAKGLGKSFSSFCITSHFAASPLSRARWKENLSTHGPAYLFSSPKDRPLPLSFRRSFRDILPSFYVTVRDFCRRTPS